ncbi:conserved hypothetical protein [Gloeothece citriformis PCC 7424]|uniref:Cytoplasmic protein n=1 Tax=Gloeothece citriformis (strain PCC 7424) TaxID=65393 RepID=B7KIX0_GLOC7|nr:DUF4385 domain-containing protein [Gloeothece citriformis]ACK70806.1 conserved hypothetical protein [Gloeothece citriformis PCC 7424]
MFDYSLDFENINFRQSPELYKIGRGEQGVLLVEPYKSEILPHWRFKTPEIAKKSSEIIYQMFLDYLNQDDFIGADMARKFLQMGYTRARRYANHKSGRKYKRDVQTSNLNEEKDAKKREVLPNEFDPIKAESAAIFKEKWLKAKTNQKYLILKKKHQQMYELT